MSALSFYTRPTYWCAKCGCPCEQEIDIDDAGSTRSIWCNNNHCPQSHQRVHVSDPIYTMVGSRYTIEPENDTQTIQLPLGDPTIEDTNGRC